MVFKLVRIDAEEPNKIQLPLGTHLIGRGKFLDCDDKRISRNHGHLIITEDGVSIEALHQNPCFFSKKGSEEKQVLKKAFKETLENGDRFGLLPGTYWFEVLYCTEAMDSQATDLSDTQELPSDKASNHEDTLQNERALSGADGNATSAERMDDNEDCLLNFDLNETVENTGRCESPSLLDKQNEPQQDSANQSLEPAPTTPVNQSMEAAPSTPDPANIENPDPPEPNLDNQTDQAESPHSGSKTPKRSHSPDDDVVKRIKTEPVDVKQELLIKQEPDAQAGPSNDPADQPDAPKADVNKASPPQAQPAPPRERCVYGASCYRRNPAHKAQFAHPSDPDWGVGDKTPCPYGAACRKREPRHWQVHDHPAPAPPPGAQVVVRHGRVFYINAHAVHFHDDHFEVEDDDGDSVDFDYEF